MNSPYFDMMNQELDTIYPSVSSHLKELDQFPLSIQEKVIGALLGRCDTSHYANLYFAFNAIAQIPKACLATHLESAITQYIDLNDEWQFSRLVELLIEIKSPLINKYLDIGLNSDVGDVREAAEGYTWRPVFSTTILDPENWKRYW